ncbi:MAG: MBL fold metallo-hydrolase [Pseudomonadales bacterium]|uniref:MBL fold metallo-hydrolase n=1 Tax=Ekhidna sp. TaxID=2608089 RepID=UPI0032EB7C33
MNIQLIRNATLKVTYGGQTFLIDPYFAPAFSQMSFGGKTKNPVVDLPFSIEQILENVDAVIISHLHPDHFDEAAQKVLPKDTKIYCQPSDARFIQEMGFSQVISVDKQVEIGNITLTRTACQHGSGEILSLMGDVSGFVFQHSREDTLYWCGDTIWCVDVMQTIDQFDPKVIVCHGGGNRFYSVHPVFAPAFTSDSEVLVMDEQEVIILSEYAPESLVIATHIGALDHETVTRHDLRELAKQRGIGDRLLVPEDGKKFIFETLIQ